MWRGFFSAVGIVLVICGLECMVLDHAILAGQPQADTYQNSLAIAPFSGGSLWGPSQEQLNNSRIFRPAEATPWSLVATGAITLLYAISYRRPA